MASDIIGTVVSVQGAAEVKTADGKIRVLLTGDQLRDGDVVLSGASAQVVLQLDDGGTVTIGSGQSVTITAELSATDYPAADETQVAGVDPLVKAILGNENLDQLLEATAAGSSAPADDSHGFVRLLRIVENVDPVSGLSTSSIGITNTDLEHQFVPTLKSDPEPEPVNAPPVAANDSVSTAANTPITIDVMGNDSDPDGNPLTIIGMGDAPNGTVTLNPDGTITYTPNAGTSGDTSFSYTISDGHGGTSTATVAVQPRAWSRRRPRTGAAPLPRATRGPCR